MGVMGLNLKKHNLERRKARYGDDHLLLGQSTLLPGDGFLEWGSLARIVEDDNSP